MISIPTPIEKSDEYKSLTIGLREAFLRRLVRIEEIAHLLASESSRLGERSFDEFIENLELDVSIRQEYELYQLKDLTRWLTHYSWTFDICPVSLRQYLLNKKDVLNRAEISINATHEQCDAWLRQAGTELIQLLNDFSLAPDFTCAIGGLFLIDIAFSRLLTGCYLVRLGDLTKD